MREEEGKEGGTSIQNCRLHNSRNGVDIKIGLSRFREERVCRGVSAMALTHNEHKRIVERGSHRTKDRKGREREREREEEGGRRGEGGGRREEGGGRREK